jgi:hypothetical protein
MAGLLGDVLPYIYSRGNALRRGLLDTIQNPVASMEQTAGLLQDYRSEDQRLNAQAFADPRQPFNVTDKKALDALSERAMAGPMAYAPAGMTINVNALRQQFPDVAFDLSQSGNRATTSKMTVLVHSDCSSVLPR